MRFFVLTLFLTALPLAHAESENVEVRLTLPRVAYLTGAGTGFYELRTSPIYPKSLSRGGKEIPVSSYSLAVRGISESCIKLIQGPKHVNLTVRSTGASVNIDEARKAISINAASDPNGQIECETSNE